MGKLAWGRGGCEDGNGGTCGEGRGCLEAASEGTWMMR